MTSIENRLVHMKNVKQKIRFLVIIFAFLSTAFLSNAKASDYRGNILGPGDIVKIVVYGHPDMSTEVKVNENGNITFPLLGEVMVDGLTSVEAERKLEDLLRSRDILRKPQINILTASLQSQMVSVLGSVRNQGRYPIEGKRSLSEVLAMAGGILPEGGDTVIVIRSDGSKYTKEVIDFLEMIRTGELDRNLNVRSDDLIYVERSPRFYIYGEVQRAGTYKLERNMTVIQALSTGGGLTVRGTERGLRIQRRDADGNMQILTVKASDLVQPDDVIFIKESLF